MTPNLTLPLRRKAELGVDASPRRAYPDNIGNVDRCVMTATHIPPKVAAELLDVTVMTVHRWIASGKLEAHKLSPRKIWVSLLSVYKLLPNTPPECFSAATVALLDAAIDQLMDEGLYAEAQRVQRLTRQFRLAPKLTAVQRLDVLHAARDQLAGIQNKNIKDVLTLCS